MLGLDDTTDPYRLFYGLSQICVGLALFHLWQLVPLEVQKAKGDSDVSTVITPLNTPCDSRGHSRTPSGTSLSGIVSGMGQRAISIQDLACHSRLEYY